MSIHYLSRTGIETEDSVTAGFSCGLSLATSLPEALCSSPPRVAPALSRICQFRLRFEPKTPRGLAILWHKSSFRIEALYFLGKNGPCHFHLLYQVWRCFVLFFDNPQSCTKFPHYCSLVWVPAWIAIVSKWSDASGSSSLLNLRIVPCTDLLLLRRHWADLHKLPCGEATPCFLRFRWSEQTSYHVLCFLIPFSQRHWRHEILGGLILYVVGASSFLQFCPNFRLIYQNKSRTITFLIQVPRKTNDRVGIWERTSQL